MEKLESTIRRSLLDMAEFVQLTNWRGREREAVSLYAFGFLAPRCEPHNLLRKSTQIGLDVAVPQLSGPRRKKLVCKDLVIWPEPAGTCWDEAGKPTRFPIAILEWKTRTSEISKYDEEWLLEFSKRSFNFVGYAVSLEPSARTRMTVTRVSHGLALSRWLHFPE